ncbi:ABC transporter substrate-binding protein [Microbacterium sp. No. 7]|uniref:ABC transporter substrate-binding protein n=1 Tax=Microbacterium sp. No. 7 TaxID=1714373 RepID=UPI0006D285D4|nr:ABC transporter substrate-binding protein [Microbacterium sp. No. 7]ALJ21206.1 hypothetical protein AOA12_15370 [Microbacterium sp. No. 7]
MISRKRSVATAFAALTVAALTLTACAGNGGTPQGSESANGGATSEGEPVAGGIAQIIEPATPTSLDPARMQNLWYNASTIGNALYGALLRDDPVTGDLTYELLEDMTTDDGGKTFTVKVREGVTFSDGTPFTAEAVKYGWDRLRAPETGSADIGTSALVESTEVVDDLTLTVTLVTPIPNFPSAVIPTTMNWIAKPEALEAGQAAFDANPIGAGPFVLKNWARQDVVSLERNENYWNDPYPYLDGIEVRGMWDTSQRFNALIGGQADLVMESGAENLAKAEDSGFFNETLPLNAGSGFGLNTTKAPFDDVRARQALSYALDLEAFNLASLGGYGVIPETLFVDASPFHSDIPLHTYDPEKAQELFDELAAEGKPVDFKVTFFAGSSTQYEALQAQLNEYDNVTIGADQRDPSEAGLVTLAGDFQITTTSILVGAEPDPRLGLFLHSDGRQNYTRISDAELDAALEAGRHATDLDERIEAYETVQERVVELTPYVFTSRISAGVMANDEINGITRYGIGSMWPATLWLAP